MIAQGFLFAALIFCLIALFYKLQAFAFNYAYLRACVFMLVYACMTVMKTGCEM